MNDHQQVGEAPNDVGGEPEHSLRPAAENPWYILATVHGEQKGDRIDEDLHARNRRAWNRWVSSAIFDKAKSALIEKHGVDPGELVRFKLHDHERQDIEERTADRCAKFGLKLLDPGRPANPAEADFGGVNFVARLVCKGLIFPGATFTGAVFRDSVSFEGVVFRDRLRFNRATFRDWAWFGGATFQSFALFEGATFRGGALFGSTTFRDAALFESTTFRGPSRFEGATFRGAAAFSGATFQKLASFEGATFRDSAWFGDSTFRPMASLRGPGTTFRDAATFSGATFRGRTTFSGATFRSVVLFDSATFRHSAFFERSTFRGGAYFDGATFRAWSRFRSATFKAWTRFDDVRFGESPDFRDAELTFSTTWRRVPWPPPKSERAEDDVEHYAALRHAMRKAERPDHELLFFALELDAKRHTDADLLQRLAIGAFLVLSKGGRSVGRPIGAWAAAFFASFLVQTVALKPDGFAIPSPYAYEILRMALGSALVLGVPIFDPRRLEFIERALSAATAGTVTAIPGSLQLLQLAHAGFSALCLFLMALAIRNWLRLR